MFNLDLKYHHTSKSSNQRQAFLMLRAELHFVRQMSLTWICFIFSYNVLWNCFFFHFICFLFNNSLHNFFSFIVAAASRFSRCHWRDGPFLDTMIWMDIYFNSKCHNCFSSFRFDVKMSIHSRMQKFLKLPNKAADLRHSHGDFHSVSLLKPVNGLGRKLSADHNC